MLWEALPTGPAPVQMGQAEMGKRMERGERMERKKQLHSHSFKGL